MSNVPAAPPVPAPDAVDPATIAAWPAHRAEVADRLAPALGTAPTQRRALAYVDCLLSGAERKNGWQLAEANGDPDPYGIQYLLNRAAGRWRRPAPPCAATCRSTWGIPRPWGSSTKRRS